MTFAEAQQTALMDNGEKIALYEDGTWGRFGKTKKGDIVILKNDGTWLKFDGQIEEN